MDGHWQYQTLALFRAQVPATLPHGGRGLAGKKEIPASDRFRAGRNLHGQTHFASGCGCWLLRECWAGLGRSLAPFLLSRCPSAFACWCY